MNIQISRGALRFIFKFWVDDRVDILVGSDRIETFWVDRGRPGLSANITLDPQLAELTLYLLSQDAL